MEELVGGLKIFWATLKPVQKGVVLGIPALLVVGMLAALTMVVSTAEANVVLFQDLEPADAAQIVAELEKSKIHFELADGGSAVLVEAGEISNLRVRLGGMHLPRGKAGFELFDESQLGITERGMSIKYQRALQGELARTLEGLDQVDSATVLLNIAQAGSFLETNARSTASVALRMNPKMGLNTRQVDGVKHLVSRAVNNLEPEDVSIVDSSGTPLTGEEVNDQQTAMDSMALAERQAKIRRLVENDLEQKVKRLLEPTYGVGGVAVSVSVEIDFRDITKESEEYTPVVGDQGIERSFTEHRKSATGIDDAPGGIPGTTSNIPGYLGVSPESSGATESSEYDLDIQYEINREITSESLPPGAIIRRSASVGVDTDVWDTSAENKLTLMVANAIGANIAGGDSIAVQAFEFAVQGSQGVPREYVSAVRNQAISKAAGWVIALIMLVVLALVFRSIVTTAFPEQELAYSGGERPRPPAAEGDDFELLRLDQVGKTHQDKMRTEIHRMIEDRPDTVISLIRTWLLEDT